MTDDLTLNLDTAGCSQDSIYDPEQPDDFGPNAIINPVTGVLVDPDDLDSLIRGCDDCKQAIADMRSFERTLREAAWKATTGDTKTRRIRGKEVQAKVVDGDVWPNQAILKEAWQSYPQFRDQFLRIGSINLKARETKKLESMSTDDPAFAQFARMIDDAVKTGSKGLPSVYLEPLPQ